MHAQRWKRIACAVVLALLPACSAMDGLESTALDRARQPIVVPIVRGSWPPLCWHFPLAFWSKPTCA